MDKLKGLDLSVQRSLSYRSGNESPDPEQELLRHHREFMDQQMTLLSQAATEGEVPQKPSGIEWMRAFGQTEQENAEKVDNLSDTESDTSVEMNSRSRYKNEYQALAVLGRGGGGEVVKVGRFVAWHAFLVLPSR